MNASIRPLDWKALVALEPRLNLLLNRAFAVRYYRRSSAFCANAAFHGYGRRLGQGLKLPMSALVGCERRNGHPILCTSRAYDIAYDKLYSAIPPCRNCECVTSGGPL